MTNWDPDFKLSPEASAELKQITLAEYGPGMTDDEISEMGIRLLKFFDLILPKMEASPVKKLLRKPADAELAALRYIHRCLHEEKKAPTVRGVSEVIGLRSSRSGARMMENLVTAGYVERTPSGQLSIKDGIPGLNA